jgi:hypothetical protein
MRVSPLRLYTAPDLPVEAATDSQLREIVRRCWTALLQRPRITQTKMPASSNRAMGSREDNTAQNFAGAATIALTNPSAREKLRTSGELIFAAGSGGAPSQRNGQLQNPR